MLEALVFLSWLPQAGPTTQPDRIPPTTPVYDTIKKGQESGSLQKRGG